MAERKVYHVVPRAEGGRAVEGEGSKRASGLNDRQSDAVDQATALAKAQPLGEVKIHGKDSKIREEHTYGKDPFPSKG